MFLRKHHTLRYILSRLNQILYEKKNSESPWFTKNATILISQLLRKDDVGVEYGSGRSTLWFAKRCKYLTSIEHDLYWFNNIKNKVAELCNVDYRLLPLSDEPNKSEYYKFILSVDDESLDFFINDGKYRDYVALASIKKLKCGGIYILDNAERYLNNNLKLPASILSNKMDKNWEEFYEFTAPWRKIWTTDGVSSTLILIKI